jgi:transcriptional regulator with XRE-family HTH domain
VDYLSLIERGVSAPSFETLERKAKWLRLPIAQLLCSADLRGHYCKMNLRDGRSTLEARFPKIGTWFSIPIACSQ